MIRMIQNSSAGHAKAYFSDSLSKADYYINDQELNGKIQGRLAERLGLNGSATKEVFFALCENINPKTGQSLTPETKQERRVGYDINFHCPKSVSILHGLSNDDHLIEAFQSSVQETMHHIEADVKTRVRKQGQYNDRITGELLWADFIHQTSRPVAGSLPDPHLHAHCFVFNATWDNVEQKVKAGQFGDVKRDMPYYQARFHKLLSDKLINLGYQVRRTDKSFEIEGVPQNVIDLFSKRSDEIDRIAKEKGITDAKELDGLGARTRANKQKGVGMDELKANWRKQIFELDDQGQGKGSEILRFAPEKERTILDPKHCVDHAIEHGFERASVLADRKILESAFRYGIGDIAVTVDTITDQFNRDERIIHVKEKSRTMCTTKSVLAEEQHMVQLARHGQGQLIPLYGKAPELKLEGQQAAAVKHVLTTPHRVSIIRGAAGSGKTTLMKEAVARIEEAGKQVIVVAPTSEASRGVLRSEGFESAETVTKLLNDQALQDTLKNQVLWVDEAGLLGTKDMTHLLELAEKQNARLILGGDTRQHASVVRGDALRILNTEGGIQAAEVNKIYRQRNEQYRHVVEDLSKGNVAKAFAKLDSMEVIKEIDPLNSNEQLVNDYVAAVKKGKSTLVISPTHKQGDAITNAIRTELRTIGILDKKETQVTRLLNLNLTDAQKSDWRNLHAGHVVQFSQNTPGIQRGSIWDVQESSENTVILKNEKDQTVSLPTDKSSLYDVYRKSKIAVSKNDTVRITRNGFDEKNNRLNNGQLLQVVSVRKNGDMVLRNTVSKNQYQLKGNFGHLAHAHCVTSYASQGKTVDEVFISQPASTFGATDAKQFYVSVSRGRERAHIYTDDKARLLENASEMGDRESAIELVTKKKPSQDIIQQHIRQDVNRNLINKPKAMSKDKTYPKDRSYEPGI
ncbi:MobF family relaxase [Arcicella lustrica]|uniref:MobF family relaxase n=1 Tax=Arcicella lustrica TaxID=2984196 RepID=A0ABU5SGG4_9BACT|nr:MobF family relaxase [Arcicella sp. DC25W]MEA5426388.1 MobF family relaxase [Arcicella sp. DC25W]